MVLAHPLIEIKQANNCARCTENVKILAIFFYYAIFKLYYLHSRRLTYKNKNGGN